MSSSYVRRRLIQLVPSFFLVIVLTFVIINLAPGDPSAALAGEFASPEYVVEIRKLYGFDRPVHERLLIYIGNMLTGNLGRSYFYGVPATQVVIERIPATLLLVFPSIVLSIVIGLPLGIFAARKRPSRTTAAIVFQAYILFSIPIFVFGLLLMIIFAVYLAILPSGGMISQFYATGLERAADVLRHLVLPMLTLALIWGVPQFVRLTYSAIVEVSKEEFITTARAIGLDEGAVFRRHAFRNAMLPVATIAGIWISSAITGAVFTETVFSWPGIGSLLFDSILLRDYTVIMFIFILTAISVIIVSLITDIIYARLDPRIRLR